MDVLRCSYEFTLVVKKVQLRGMSFNLDQDSDSLKKKIPAVHHLAALFTYMGVACSGYSGGLETLPSLRRLGCH